MAYAYRKCTFATALLAATVMLQTGCEKSETSPPATPAATPAPNAKSQADTPLVPDPGTELVTLTVSGMHCEGCAQTVQDRLGKLNGVRQARVSFAAKSAWVAVEPGGPDTDRLVAEIVDVGYKAAPTTQPAASAPTQG